MQFTIEKNVLTRTDEDVIVAGNYFDTEAIIEISGKWQTACEVYAYFKRGELVFMSKLMGGKTLVPSEMLASEGFFEMSFSAQCDNGSILKSSIVHIKVSGSHDPEHPTVVVFRETKGDTGDTGDVGAKGDKGDTGDVGAKGDTGDTGDVGAKGDKGDTGDVGAKGISAYEHAVAGGYENTEPQFGEQLSETVTNRIADIAAGRVYAQKERCIYKGTIFTALRDGATQSHFEQKSYGDWWRASGEILEMEIYVSPSGSDTEGEGTSASPFKTLKHALDGVPRGVDNFNADIYMEPGNYLEEIIIKDFRSGGRGIYIQSTTGLATDVVIKSFLLKNCVGITFKKISINCKSSSSNFCIRADDSKNIAILGCALSTRALGEGKSGYGFWGFNVADVLIGEGTTFLGTDRAMQVDRAFNVLIGNVSATQCNMGFYLCNCMVVAGQGYDERNMVCTTVKYVVVGGHIW